MQRKPGAAHPSNQGGVGGKQGEGDRRCADTVLVAGASMTLSECFARLDHVVLRANAAGESPRRQLEARLATPLALARSGRRPSPRP